MVTGHALARLQLALLLGDKHANYLPEQRGCTLPTSPRRLVSSHPPCMWRWQWQKHMREVSNRSARRR